MKRLFILSDIVEIDLNMVNHDDELAKIKTCRI